MTLPAPLVLAGLGFLLAAGGLGVIFAAILACPTEFPWGRPCDRLARSYGRRAGGWFTLTALGVSYRLLGMFMLAPDDRGRFGHTAFVTTAGGLAIAWLASFAQMLDRPALHILMTLGEVVAALGVMLYLADMVRLYRARRRRSLELS